MVIRRITQCPVCRYEMDYVEKIDKSSETNNSEKIILKK